MTTSPPVNIPWQAGRGKGSGNCRFVDARRVSQARDWAAGPANLAVQAAQALDLSYEFAQLSADIADCLFSKKLMMEFGERSELDASGNIAPVSVGELLHAHSPVSLCAKGAAGTAQPGLCGESRSDGPLAVPQQAPPIKRHGR